MTLPLDLAAIEQAARADVDRYFGYPSTVLALVGEIQYLRSELESERQHSINAHKNAQSADDYLGKATRELAALRPRVVELERVYQAAVEWADSDEVDRRLPKRAERELLEAVEATPSR